MHINGLRIVKGCRPYRHQPAELPDVGNCEPCDSDGQREFDFDDCVESMNVEPTDTQPGSEERIVILEERFRRRQQLFVADDRTAFPGAVYDLTDI